MNRIEKPTHDIHQAVMDIKTAIMQGQYEAAKGVNRIQLAVYYGIGKYVSQHTRKGVWGSGALDAISEQLRRELPGLRGYSATALRNMRKFYEAWIMLDANSSITNDELKTAIAIAENESNKRNGSLDGKSAIAIAEVETKQRIDVYNAIRIPDIKEFPIEDFFRLPFTHHIRVIEGTKDLDERYYFIHRIVEENIPSDNLASYIKNNPYDSQKQMPSNFAKTISNPEQMRKAVTMFKDSYFLDFINVEEIGLRDSIDVDERMVEKEIVNKVKNFIMTIGRDFTFMGNQQLLEVYGVEHFPDLLFFNRELNAMVVIELKTGEFKTSYLGQLMGYLTILDEKIRKPHENPSIGIVLCKSANREYVEFMIRDYTKPMGVATYKTSDEMPEHLRKALPTNEEFARLLEKKHNMED